MDLPGKAIEIASSIANYTLNFEEKKQALKRKLEQLESMEIDVIKELENAESRTSKKRKNEVAIWLNNVGRVKNDIETMKQEAGPGLQRILFGKLVEEKTEEVRELIDQREKVGIVVRMKGCNLILTTHSLDVCRGMGCQKTIKVVSLSKFEAWQLFQDKLERPLSPDLMEIAKSIARECAGLPLGIIIIAASMRGADDICEWRNALRELQESQAREGDTENEVFQVLKFSYNRSTNSALQQCFLYNGLYPEDHNIDREEVIEYLIDEGIIKGESRQAKFDEGHTMLNTLVKVCLLESNSHVNCSNGYVRMHDLLRDMAIQIMEVDPQVFVKAGKELVEMPEWRNWPKDLVRISLMYNDIPVISSGFSPTSQTFNPVVVSQ
ncbi:hypothetical protein GH714_035223 [Hevea brasiliensis]|uniref:Uncharacterized protein n=1 Tax=Hevea brasiliensis TaxID=3981 RepID=A0A6A6NAD8_HEVBR|nr:hypothetical protein GH714_035223 [Hevea brasiliensis]